MKWRNNILALLVLLSVSGYAQQFSNKGRDFWTGYGLHFLMELQQDNSQQMVLYFSAEQAANVKVTIKGATNTTVQTYAVPANSVIASNPMPKTGGDDCRLYDVPVAYGGLGTSRIFQRSIHIESDVPIVAYAHISGAGSSGATMLMPVESWGYSYLSVNSQQALRQAVAGEGAFNWIFVTADHDNTVIEVTPSNPLRNGATAGVPFTVTINRGEIYQVVGAAINASTGYDLTGTKIKSVANSAGQCYPVGVFSGSSSTLISCNGQNQGFADNLIQQAFPIQAWGKTYCTAPFSASTDATINNPSIYRIAVKDATTVVKKNGAVLPASTLINNTYYQYTSTTADYIEADKPIMVTQYLPSMSDGANNSCNYQGLGDPEMVYLSPLEQAINSVGFYRNNVTNIDVNYLTLVIPTTGLNSLTIDGNTSFSRVYTHPNKPGYSVVVQRWTASKAQCQVKSDSTFTAVTYGLGQYDSYAYNAGTYINNLSGTLSLHNTEGAAGAVHAYTCKNTPVELSVIMAYQPTKLVWHLSELTNMTPNADVTQFNPVSSGTVVYKGLIYYKYTLPGNFTFSEAGTFRFTVSSTHPLIENCNNTDNLLLDVVVKDMGKIAAFTDVHSGCIPDKVNFAWDPTYKGSYNVSRWLWTFPDGSTGTKDTAIRTFNAAGQYDIKLKVTSEEGCIADTTVKINVEAPSVMSITATPTAICENGTVNFTATATGASPITSWYWDFGNAATSTVQSPQNIVFGRYGTYTVRLTGKTATGCGTDTAKQLITVNANPKPLFSYPAGCLPLTGTVAFTSKATAADGSAITAHAWNFGDPNATTANPNTATIANPSHDYQLGNYNIHYTVTTDKGCTKDTVVNATFNPSPAFSYTALPDVCEYASPISVATATVTNNVPGTGIYKGTGVTTAGIFTPATAGSGTHTIWYVYTTAAGCIDSVSTAINVLKAPIAGFTVTADACLGNAVTISDQSQDAGAALTTWYWNFGDNTTDTKNNNTPFTKSYASAKAYTIALSVTDNRGCASKSVTQTTTIHPSPVVVFTLPSVVCMPKGLAAFGNQSSVADGSALQYQWSFGDGSANSNDMRPTHAYAASGSYVVTLTATSAYGCSSNITATLSSFADQPVATFTVAPATICQGSAVTFTDASTTAAGTLSNWYWNFGDGSNATRQNTTHTYSNAGLFNAKLVVSNSAGCLSDTATQQVMVHVQPVVDAGPNFTVAQGTVVTFKPTLNNNTISVQWSPGGELSNPTTLQPSYKATHDETFTLTATDGQCTASDQLTVKILRLVNVPNAFSPNGDGTNDTWVINNLSDYQGCLVEVFNRWGQRVFRSTGYSNPWDGRFNGNMLPLGVYYYVIDLKNGFSKIAGYVTIVR